MAKPVFTLRLVWDSLDHSPEWELETEHDYFANWAVPAFLAEGHTSPHPRLLELRRGRMFLRLNDGAVLELGDDGSRLVRRTAGTNAGPKDDLVGHDHDRSLSAMACLILTEWLTGHEYLSPNISTKNRAKRARR